MSASTEDRPSTHGDAGPNETPAPNSQTPGHPSFRRQRASRACETCHSRKVRCDAASLGVPCTNCVAFAIECKIPVPKRKKNHTSKAKDGDSDRDTKQDFKQDFSPRTDAPHNYQHHNDVGYTPSDATPTYQLSEAQAAQQESQSSVLTQFMKPKFARAPIKEAGRVAYLGESSNLSLLVHDRHGTTDVVHYPLPENIRGTRARLTEPDQQEIEILQQRGAFLLPPKSLCDDLVDSFFRWVAPVVPVINRSRFMRRYKDTENPPSLLLLQAILLAGSRVCSNPQLMDANGSTTPAAMTFYKRAKALYDANYEDDRITIVQALILMGWYWEGPEDVTKNVFYWTRVAIVVAQGSGMHRSVESSQLSRPDKRLWKRVWWTLFTRDRSVAVALGRPVSINTDDSDVGMVAEDDFIEDEVDCAAEYPPVHVHVQFFLQYVKLCEIMGLVLSQQYSVASKSRRTNAIDLTHSDMALADWLQNCPREVYWERPRHHFWSALLHANYYTTLCLLHRAHMPPASPSNDCHSLDMAYPSRNIAFQAAGMITSIVENLQAHDEVRYTPAFIVYSLFSALIMHVYQMRSSVSSVVSASQERINVCMGALKEVSKVWLVARMVHTLFESILGNKVLEERLQKAAGKRHQKSKLDASIAAPKSQVHCKRKYEDMEFGYTSGPPAPQLSYERSCPQTPSLTPNRDLGQPTGGAVGLSSPPTRNASDQFVPLGASRGGTRPTSPFLGGLSIPATPPDLFLVTRNSPSISQSLWENFQPDQLFPDGTNMSMPFAPPTGNPVDPQLQIPQQMQPQQVIQPQDDGDFGLQGMASNMVMPQVNMEMHNHTWSMDGMMANGLEHQHDDNWSNSSRSVPIVPNTLNVEDWFQFFGINGDLNNASIEAR